MDQKMQKQLQIIATKIRIHAVDAVYRAASGHPGGSLSIAEPLAYLYFKEMNIDPKRPRWPGRDRFVLSKGHCSPAYYSALALRGYFPLDELRSFRQLGHILQGHPDMKHIPGVDMSTGSLGQGISAACGMAKAAKMFGDGYRVYTINGDGELEEGQVWEAAMFAHQYRLDNLCAWVDYNGLQIDGKISDVMSPEPIAEKFRAFGWHAIEIEAHDFNAIEQAYAEARRTDGVPTVIVAHSVKGRGVSFMENRPEWHGSAPNAEQYRQAMDELHAQLDALGA